MSHRTRLLVAMVAVGVVAVMFLLAAFLDTGIIAPTRYNGDSQSPSTFDPGTESALRPLPDPRNLRYATKEIMVPDATYEQRLEFQYANYERIVVEVHTDGSLCVLGRIMPMDGLRSLLDTQQLEGVKTLVAIQPEDNCVYRHIDDIIRLCQDLGVPHQMVSASASHVSKAEPAPPA